MCDLQVGLGFRPGFGQQPDPAPQVAFEHQPPEPIDAVADDADGARPTPNGAGQRLRYSLVRKVTYSSRFPD